MSVTIEEIIFVHRVRFHDTMLRAWLKRTNRGNSYRPEDVPGHIDVPTNEERSRAEVIDFRRKPLPYGQPYGCYLSASPAGAAFPYRLTTFMGDLLADAIKIKFRKHRRGFLTDTVGSFWARGIDGRLYYGRHNGKGLHATMRLAKNQLKGPRK